MINCPREADWTSSRTRKISWVSKYINMRYCTKTPEIKYLLEVRICVHESFSQLAAVAWSIKVLERGEISDSHDNLLLKKTVKIKRPHYTTDSQI